MKIMPPRQENLEPPFEPWDSDHTSLVHILWGAEHDGLSLKADFDAIATRIMHSRWLAAQAARLNEAAWNEGYDRGFYDREQLDPMLEGRDASEGRTENPYEPLNKHP